MAVMHAGRTGGNLMRQHLGLGLLSGGATALALSLGVATVSAAPISASTLAATWTVEPGGTITGTTGSVTFTDTKSGVVLTCTSSMLNGKAKKGSGLSATALIRITALTFTGCTAADRAFTVTANVNPDAQYYVLNALSYNSTDGGTTTATIKDLDFSASAVGCTFSGDGKSGADSYTGKVTATYSNSADTLAVSPTAGGLKIWDVQGCFGTVANRDPVSYSATYDITPAQTISSP
jgi:hypothetical protein